MDRYEEIKSRAKGRERQRERVNREARRQEKLVCSSGDACNHNGEDRQPDRCVWEKPQLAL